MKVSLTVTYKVGDKIIRHFDLTIDAHVEKYLEMLQEAIGGAAKGFVKSYTSKLIVK